MLGLTILFFKLLWIVVTIVAAVIGAKIAIATIPRSYAVFIGIFAGFMLTMGAPIIYWTVEYYQIKSKVEHLCKTEGGITVYVTPEQWRKQIGEAEWEKLIPYNKTEVLSSSENGKKVNIDGLVFEYSRGNTHLNDGILENDKVALYIAYGLPQPLYGSKSISLIIEKSTNKILIKDTSFYYGVGAIANNLSGLKFWLNNIQGCNYTKDFVQIAHQYSNVNNIGVK